MPTTTRPNVNDRAQMVADLRRVRDRIDSLNRSLENAHRTEAYLAKLAPDVE